MIPSSGHKYWLPEIYDILAVDIPLLSNLNMALTQKQIIPDAGFLPLTSTKIPITAYSNMNEPEVKPNTDESSCHLQANGHAVDIKNGNHEHHNGIGNHEAHIKKSEEILAILKLYLLDKLPGWHDYWAEGAPSFITVIRSFVEKGETVEMCLPAFPWKSANKVEKVLGILPDKAEEVSLRRLNGMCEAVGQVYEPGAKLLIISDGLVYNGKYIFPMINRAFSKGSIVVIFMANLDSRPSHRPGS